MLVTGYTAAWILWLIAFAIIEGVALVRRAPGDTLTEHVRAWGGVTGKGPWCKIRRVLLLAFLAWLMGHMLFPGFV